MQSDAARAGRSARRWTRVAAALFAAAGALSGGGAAAQNFRGLSGGGPSPGNPVFSSSEQPAGSGEGAPSFFLNRPLGTDQTFQIGGALELSNQLDHVRPRNGRSTTNFFLEWEASVYLNITRWVTINSVFKLEQVRDPSGDGFIRDHAGWIDQLYASIHLGPVTLYGGKIHPRFGLAWDLAPGVYGADFAEDYEITERLGGGAVWRLPIDIGKHDLSAEWFRADTSFLTRSIFMRTLPGESDATRFSRLNRSDGGLSNTGSPSDSFSLVGRDIPVPGNLGYLAYGLSYARQGAGVSESRAQRGIAAAVAWEIPLSRRLTLTPIFEFVGLDGADGGDLRRNYYVLGAELSYYAWRVSGAMTFRNTNGTNADGGVRTRDTLYTLSLGYDLSQLTRINGLEAAVGWRRANEGGEVSNSYGAQVVYAIRF